MNLCWAGVHKWIYGDVYYGNINGKFAKYNVQQRKCSCCGKAEIVMAGEPN